MAFSRKILIGIICASCVFATDAFAPATDKIYTKRTINGKVVMQDQYCNTNDQRNKAKIEKNSKGVPVKQTYYPPCKIPADANVHGTKYKCAWTEGFSKLSCFATTCENGFLLKVKSQNAKQSVGNCVSPETANCSSTRPLRTFYWTDPIDKQRKEVSDGTCESAKCNAQHLNQHHAIWGKVPDKNKNICIFQECKNGYYLDTKKNDCIPCQACKPTHANCELKSSNVKGEQGVKSCTYETSCESGFGNEQNHGEYNPSCSAIEQPNNNTITYDLQGGRWPEDPGLTTYDPTQDTDIGTKPEKENYIFMGWCIDSPTCASPVNAIPSGKSGQIKLYARWKQETIAQLSNAEKVNELENIEFPEQTTCSPLDLYNLNAIEGILKENKCIPTKCKNEFGNANNEPENGACLQKNVDAPEEFVITLEQNGGTGCEDALETYTRGEPMSVACLPTKGGFVFDGWYRDAEFKESASKAKEEQIKQQMQENGYRDGDINYKNTIFITANDSGDKTFYAKWIQKEKNTPRTECTEPEKAVHPNAVAFEYTDGVCKPTACKENYNLQGGKCVKSNLQQAQEDYDAAKENEQSLANRTLGSLSMAATGIGGMELAMGLSEQNADKQAEADMTAYISTFNCKVGDKRYKGGETNVELPGANQLTQLYQEYTTLAADLKARKEALGKAPGIESEVVLDKANMGLYDNVGHGIENGAYASLYRASKGNENDIQKLQDQQGASKKRVTAGAVVGGVGAVGGIIGNIAINSNGTTRTTSVADGEPANNKEISTSNGDDEVVFDQRSIDDYEEDGYLDDQSFQLQDQSDNTGITESTPKAQTFGCGVGSNIIASLKGCSSTYANQAELTKCTTCIENAGTYENGRCYIEIIGWACLGKGWTGKGTPNPIPCDAANRYNDCHIIRKYVDAEKPFVCDPVELMPGKKAVLSGCGRHGWTAGDKHPPMNIGGGGKEQDCKLPLVNNTDWRKMYTKGSAIGIVYNGKTTVTANWCMPAANSSPWNNKNHTGNSIHLSPTSLMAGGERKDKWFSLN